MKNYGLIFALPALLFAGACGDDGGGNQPDASGDMADASGDGIDAAGMGVDNCGNQFGYDVNGDYSFLGGALANDMLAIDATEGTCEQYLAVEAGVGSDCGGRTPTMDVVDTSYSALATGDPNAGVGDGVDADDCAEHDPTTFPFLAGPGCTSLGQ